MPDEPLPGKWKDALTVSFTLTPADVFHGSFAMMHRKSRIWLMYGLAGIAILATIPFTILSLIGNSFSFDSLGAPICVLLFVLAFLFGVLPVRMWWRSRAVVRQTPLIQGSQTFTIGDAGVIVTNDLTRTELKWGAFVKAVETQRAFLLYISGASAYVLPKRAFLRADDLSELRHVLSACLGSKARLQRIEND